MEYLYCKVFTHCILWFMYACFSVICHYEKNTDGDCQYDVEFKRQPDWTLPIPSGACEYSNLWVTQLPEYN